VNVLRRIVSRSRSKISQSLFMQRVIILIILQQSCLDSLSKTKSEAYRVDLAVSEGRCPLQRDSATIPNNAVLPLKRSSHLLELQLGFVVLPRNEEMSMAPIKFSQRAFQVHCKKGLLLYYQRQQRHVSCVGEVWWGLELGQVAKTT